MPERSQETRHDNCSDYSGKKKVACVYPLKHVKFDFYKKSSELVVQVYVKEIKKDSLHITFKESGFLLQFKTWSAEFLKLYEGTSEETIFEWPVNLRHRIISSQSIHNLSNTKFTLTLKRENMRDQWNCLKAPNFEDIKTNNSDDKIEDSKQTNNEKNNEQFYTENKTSGSTKSSMNGCFNGTTCSQSTVESNEVAHQFKSSDNKTNNTFCRKNKISEKVKTSPVLQCPSRDHSSEIIGERKSLKDIAISDKTTNNGSISSMASVQKNDEDGSSKDYELSYDARVHCIRPGAVGLVNNLMNNLCYMNSIVQCLSAVKELRTYLLCKKHCSNINGQNKHGFEGRLAHCFGTLIEDLWSGRKYVGSAMKIKNILGEKHELFTHCRQGDAQEFLTFLLDDLHEDLKNEKKEKVFGALETGCQKDIVEKGQQYWKKFTNGNRSIIIDLFYGLTASEIRCKHCNQPSVKFDPWMQLNLPIPNDPKYLPVYVFFQDPTKQPLKVKLKVCQGTRCTGLLGQISKLVNIPANHLVLFRPEYGRIAEIYEPMDELPYSSMKEYLVACQLVANEETNHLDEKKSEDVLPDTNSNPEIQDNRKLDDTNHVPSENCKEDNNSHILRIPIIQRSTRRRILKCNYCLSEEGDTKYCTQCYCVAYCNSECQRKHWKSHRPYCKFQPEIIGCPFILSILSSQATLEKLKKKALHYASFSVTAKDVKLENAKFQLTLLENLNDFHSKGKALTKNGDTQVVNDNVCLALDWNVTRDNRVLSKNIVCENHESVESELSAEDKLCYLENCLKLYWTPEGINRETGWRCDYCKDVRPADRKTKIFRHPKNMIIHIKRFSYVCNGRKIKKVVRFPLRGLDMSPFSYGENPDEPIYDLHAVCSHHGIMNFGHYTAYSKPYSTDELNSLGWGDTDGWLKYNDNKVSCVSESDVAEAEAYILFYQRRETNATFLNAASPCSTSISTDIPKATENKSPTQGDCKNKIEPSLEFQNNNQDQLDPTTNQFSFHDSFSVGEIPLEDQLD